MDLAVVVPFHNEERYCRRSSAHFGNRRRRTSRLCSSTTPPSTGPPRWSGRPRRFGSANRSTSPSARIGKLHAIRTATAYCRDQFDARHIGFLDSDSYPSDRAWLSNSLDIIDAADGQLGFTPLHSRYVGFEEFPVFKSAYLAYEGVQHDIMKAVGWLANGAGLRLFGRDDDDVSHAGAAHDRVRPPLSALALMEGRQACLNPTLLVTSGRRITVNARNFEAWCFYERESYSKKDINANAKLNLDVPERVVDLAPDGPPLLRAPSLEARGQAHLAAGHLRSVGLVFRQDPGRVRRRCRGGAIRDRSTIPEQPGEPVHE